MGTYNPNYKSTYNLLRGLRGLRGLINAVVIGAVIGVIGTLKLQGSLYMPSSLTP